MKVYCTKTSLNAKKHSIPFNIYLKSLHGKIEPMPRYFWGKIKTFSETQDMQNYLKHYYGFEVRIRVVTRDASASFNEKSKP